ncbi:MAG TPA: hypothetical protein VII82_11700 [Polyangiaceae bacterium]|jgi:hypothetical protein
MTRSIALLSTASSTVAAFGLVAALGLASRVASAQVGFPPAEFIATTAPVYYGGHAAYWYGNRWYYRDERGGWQHYDREPPELAEHRGHGPPAKHFYGSSGNGHGGHAAGHPAGHGGGRR